MSCTILVNGYMSITLDPGKEGKKEDITLLAVVDGASLYSTLWRLKQEDHGSQANLTCIVTLHLKSEMK